MRFFFFITILFTPFLSNSQIIPQNPNQTDKNNLRQGTWTLLYDAQFQIVESEESTVFYRIITYQDDKPTGKVNDYYRSGKIQWEGTLLADRPQEVMEGICTWYYESGITQQIAIFEDGQMTSLQQFNPDGTELKSNENWESLYNQSLQFYNQQNYNKAIEIAEKSRQQAETEFGKGTVYEAYSLNLMALSYYSSGMYNTALPIYEEALRLFERTVGKNHQDYAQVGHSLGNTYYYLGFYEKAEMLVKEVLEIRKSLYGEESTQVAESLTNLATIYQANSLYEKAEGYYWKAISIQQKTLGVNHSEYGNSLFSLAVNYRVANTNFPRADSLLMEVEKVWKSSFGEESYQYAAYLEERANYYESLFQFVEIEPLLKRALSIKKKTIGDLHPQYAFTLGNLGRYYKTVSNYEEAEKLYSQAIELSQKTLGEAHPQTVVYSNDLAFLLQFIGYDDNAERIYLNNLKILETNKDTQSPYYLQSLNGLAELYQDVQLYQKAEEIYLEVIPLAKQLFGEQHQNYISILANLVKLYGRMREADKIVAPMEELLAIVNTMEDVYNPSVYRAYNDMALYQLQNSEFQTAEVYYLSAIEIAKNLYGENSGELATTYQNLALLYQLASLNKKAEEYFAKALKIQEDGFNENHPDYANTLYNLSSLRRNQKKYKEALNLYDKVFEVIYKELNQNFDGFSEREKRVFIQDKQVYIDGFQFICIEDYQSKKKKNDSFGKQLENLLNITLTFKGLLVNNTQNTKQRILQSGDEELIQKYQNWITRKNQLAQLSNLSIEEREAKEINLETLEEEINTLEKEVNHLSEPYALKFEKKTIDWKDIQRKLNPDEIAIEMIDVKFENGTNNYIVLIFTAQSTFPEMLLLENGDDLEGKYLTFYNNIINRQRQGTDKIDKISYDQYWKPIADKIAEMGDFDKIYFSPDGVYHQINLNSLYNPEAEEYLIKEQNIHIVSNLKDLIPQKGKNKSNEGIVLFGRPSYGMEGEAFSDYVEISTRSARDEFAQTISQVDWADLEGTEKEITSIDELLQSQGFNPEVYLKEKATEDQIKQLHRPRLLHIATHGFFIPNEDDSDNPFQALLQSGLVLAGVNNYFQLEEKPDTEDGILTSYEAMNLDLTNTELVVLSACQTGTGEVQTGEGVFGLQRALAVAGARNLVMSLWKVDDTATQELMTNFYQIWLVEGKDKREAFREAQIQLMTTYPNPYHWGAFILVGE